MFFLSGVARYLFVPLAEAVVFAMLASYILSRTLVPTMAMYLLRAKHDARGATRNPFVLFQRGFERGFERFRTRLSAIADHAGLSRGLCLFRVPDLFVRGFPAGSLAGPGLLSQHR